MELMKTTRLLLALCITTLLVGGCSWLSDTFTGPNRSFKMVGSENVSDFITFEGSTLTVCRDLTVNVESSEPIKVGCVFRVQLLGHQDNVREVFCTGDLYSNCRSIPIGSRVSINGRLMTPSVVVQANSAQWRGE